MKKLFTTLIVMLSIAFNLQAQDVYISPSTGHLIAAVTGSSETGFENGFSSLWRHNQLGLTMVVADGSELTGGNEIANPAGNLNTVNGKLTITGGQATDCFIVVSLPKGYRFTSYSLVLNNDLNNYRFSNSFRTQSMSKTFYETDETFDISGNAYKKSTGQMPARNDDQDYTISNQGDNMGNRLYFRLHKNNSSAVYYGVSIKSFVVEFTSGEAFVQPLQALPTATAVAVEKSSFMVGKPELGVIKPNTKNGKTYFSYDYRNVDDLEANNLLYQENAVKDGKTDEASATNKTITRTIVDGKPWFALAQSSNIQDNTYYVETPVTLTSASGKELPTGYRITGAKLEFSRGKNTDRGYTIGINRHGEVTYLQSTGSLVMDKPETGWTVSNGAITLDKANIYVAKNRNDIYYLTPNRSNNIRATFGYTTNEKGENIIYADVSERSLIFWSNPKRLYIHEADGAGEQAILTESTDHAAQLIEYSGFTPSSQFTATVYGKEGKTIGGTATVTASSGDQTVTLTGLNNDAVKFKIDGLDAGSQALVSITLTMEHLNPYISSIEIIGKDVDDPNQGLLTQTFDASNFSVRGGHFEFFVPEGTQNNTWSFEFDNLTSKYTDETYGQVAGYTGSKTGNARVAFVNSAYLNANSTSLYEIEESESSSAATTKTKLSVVEVGTVPFRFNNADQLSNENETDFESHLEEYPFSIKNYLTDTGYKDANNNVIKGDFQQVKLTAQGKNEEVAYLAVADETRYNIAPTYSTEHRYYAHYVLDIELQAKEYALQLSPVKIYDGTLYTDEKENVIDKPMFGMKVTTTEGGGWTTMDEIIKKIQDACDKKTYPGLESADQILYLDLSGLSSIHFPSSSEYTSGQIVEYLKSIREAFAPNCLIYMPDGASNQADNYAYRKEANTGFSANANIIIKDKMPFFAPYSIQLSGDQQYAKYTRELTHSSHNKENVSTLVLPFAFSIDGDSKHTNDKSKAGDGKSFTVYRLAAQKAISNDKGDTSLEGFNNNLVTYKNNVHFEFAKPNGNGTTDAYTPYLIYSYNYNDGNKFNNNVEDFIVLQYNTLIEATTQNTVADADKATTACCSQKITDTKDDHKSTGNLDGEDFTITPTYTMSGYQLPIKSENCLYFASDRFRSSWTLKGSSYLYIQPFRSWFDYVGNTSKAKDLNYGIAFGFGDDETTGISTVDADKTEKTGTYKFIHNGQLLIHTDNGVFTVDGKKVNL